MKKFLLPAILAVLCCASPLPAFADTGVEGAAFRSGGAHITYMKAILSTLDSVNSLLDTVKDKQSADAAAPGLRHLLQAMKALSRSATELGEAESVTRRDTRTVSAMERQFQDKVAEFEKKVEALPSACWKSAAFAEVLRNTLK